MLNPNEISPTHLPALSACIMAHRSKVDENRVTKLYKAARELMAKHLEPIVNDATMWKTRSIASNLLIAACTDVDTGLFVQLVGPPGTPQDDLALTFGIKFCQEYKDTLRGNRATKIW